MTITTRKREKLKRLMAVLLTAVLMLGLFPAGIAGATSDSGTSPNRYFRINADKFGADGKLKTDTDFYQWLSLKTEENFNPEQLIYDCLDEYKKDAEKELAKYQEIVYFFTSLTKYKLIPSDAAIGGVQLNNIPALMQRFVDAFEAVSRGNLTPTIILANGNISSEDIFYVRESKIEQVKSGDIKIVEGYEGSLGIKNILKGTTINSIVSAFQIDEKQLLQLTHSGALIFQNIEEIIAGSGNLGAQLSEMAAEFGNLKNNPAVVTLLNNALGTSLTPANITNIFGALETVLPQIVPMLNSVGGELTDFLDRAKTRLTAFADKMKNDTLTLQDIVDTVNWALDELEDCLVWIVRKDTGNAIFDSGDEGRINDLFADFKDLVTQTILEQLEPYSTADHADIANGTWLVGQIDGVANPVEVRNLYTNLFNAELLGKINAKLTPLIESTFGANESAVKGLVTAALGLLGDGFTELGKLSSDDMDVENHLAAVEDFLKYYIHTLAGADVSNLELGVTNRVEDLLEYLSIDADILPNLLVSFGLDNATATAIVGYLLTNDGAKVNGLTALGTTIAATAYKLIATEIAAIFTETDIENFVEGLEGPYTNVKEILKEAEDNDNVDIGVNIGGTTNDLTATEYYLGEDSLFTDYDELIYGGGDVRHGYAKILNSLGVTFSYEIEPADAANAGKLKIDDSARNTIVEDSAYDFAADYDGIDVTVKVYTTLKYNSYEWKALFAVKDLTVKARAVTVTFEDGLGNVLDTQTVAYGGDAVPPADPSRRGYTFTGWDSDDYINVTTDVTITATWKKNTTIGGGSGGSGGGNSGARVPSAPVKTPESDDSWFIDVHAGDWFYDDVYYVYDNGIMNGTGDRIFEPNTPLTRGMLVTILGRVYGADTTKYTAASYTDVAAGQYYAPYIEWGTEVGVVQGYGNGIFKPDQVVTREEMAAIFGRYVEYIKASLPKVASDLTFNDAADIQAYAKDYVAAMTEAGLLTGDNNLFRPKDSATRAQAAAIIHRLMLALKA